MKDAYSYYIEPFENFDQVIAWESSVSPSNSSRREALFIPAISHARFAIGVRSLKSRFAYGPHFAAVFYLAQS